MIVNRKLFWIDMVLLASVFILIFLKPGKLSDALTGWCCGFICYFICESCQALYII